MPRLRTNCKVMVPTLQSYGLSDIGVSANKADDREVVHFVKAPSVLCSDAPTGRREVAAPKGEELLFSGGPRA
jgi:hypothetical protein